MPWILHLDRALYVFINQTLANPVTDFLMPIVTNGRNWVVPVAAAILFMFWKGGRKAWWLAGGAVIVIALCDQSSAHWLKPVFKRIRPCNVVEGARALINCTQAYSFPSAHATNTIGAAVWFTYGFPRLRWIFFATAFLVSISRVFVGVHYPFDVLGGWVLGATISLCAVAVAHSIRSRRGQSGVSDAH
jgi:membrane-associated phospholipid phosphatase